MSFHARTRTATRSGKFLAATLALGACLPGFAADNAAVPVLKLSYQELGFPGYAPALMRARSYSMATLHLLDSKHLMLTYSLRSLVPRVPGDDENDSDRLVAGEIVELPTGKIVARTQWRLHDHSRYLWRGGEGVFILRTADELSTFAPLRGLATGTAFQRVALPHHPGIPQMVAASPDGAILTIEVQPPEVANGDDETIAPQKTKHTTIEFYRISASEGDGPVRVDGAGPVVGAPNLLRLVLDGDGYLWAEDQGRNNWQVSFNEYGGKRQNLATVHSSCSPRLSLLSRSEFLAETCKGSDDSPMLASYGFDGHENWEEPVGDNLQPPTIVTAPEAGRFAISRMVANKSGSGIYDLAPDDPLGQEIRVYQTESGDMLLHLQCADPVRAGENFDISPDGRTLAVLGRDGVEIYALRPLTDRDRKDLADVATMSPPVWHGPVVLTGLVEPVASERRLLKKVDDAGPVPAAEGSAVPAAAAATNGGSDPSAGTAAPSKAAGSSHGPLVADGAQAGSHNGPVPGSETGVAKPDTQAGSATDAVSERRKPPTLLNPGESAEYKGPSGSPQ